MKILCCYTTVYKHDTYHALSHTHNEQIYHCAMVIVTAIIAGTVELEGIQVKFGFALNCTKYSTFVFFIHIIIFEFFNVTFCSSQCKTSKRNSIVCLTFFGIQMLCCVSIKLHFERKVYMQKSTSWNSKQFYAENEGRHSKQ